ncbi:potassium-transporting ATPase subunit KdpC [Pseudomonas sp. FEN]|uniref:potassium-transporting ATPase subunit KdpC n=1 Tax=Pseudomonas sp. FEN TaxID=2767468 RepID=UPI00174EA9CA|nr:potassium-transporting ATPase subunit KdpC [Pseudomonas sp. FEN]CAD5200617.1 Potassium-transporting ATPase C chain (EC 3.6.3.12) (TC 3.A.3.7.1) [Pseudomonas sp. FEN]
MTTRIPLPPLAVAQVLFRGLLRPVLVSSVLFMLLTGLAYPALTTLVANLLFPFQAQGSLLERNGQVVGSALIGQAFNRPEYFQARPSMTQGVDPNDASKSLTTPYNAGLSGASNLGPTSQRQLDAVKARAEGYRLLNGLDPQAVVPVDAVTASASGLDPHISVANALIQTRRVAGQRQLSEDTLLALVRASIEARTFGLLGEPRVNVLQLNLALDALVAPHQPPLAVTE